jgi:hypothetical protein
MGTFPPCTPTRRVSELERPQPSPGWGRFFGGYLAIPGQSAAI